VREPRVPGEEGTVQVRPDRAPEPAALEAARAVVPEPRHDSPERGRTGIEPRPARVVLESGERLPVARIELALEQDVADHAAVAGDGLEREQADARHVLAMEAAIAAPEELVAAAHGEERSPAARRLQHLLGLRGQVLRDQELFAILPAADIQQIVRAGDYRLAHTDRPHDELVAAPGPAPLEHGDVAAVGVDVQVVRIEVPDPDPHAARSSQ